jgi:hypothetical protein
MGKGQTAPLMLEREDERSVSWTATHKHRPADDENVERPYFFVREVPNRAFPLEGFRVVGDGAMHGKAMGWASREGHGSLAGRRIVEGRRKGRWC